MRWTGTRWLRDEKLTVREAVRQVCRNSLTPGLSTSEARRVASEKTMRAVERIVASDPAIATGAAEWMSSLATVALTRNSQPRIPVTPG
jgi:hypothetical protein